MSCNILCKHDGTASWAASRAFSPQYDEDSNIRGLQHSGPQHLWCSSNQKYLWSATLWSVLATTGLQHFWSATLWSATILVCNFVIRYVEVCNICGLLSACNIVVCNFVVRNFQLWSPQLFGLQQFWSATFWSATWRTAKFEVCNIVVSNMAVNSKVNCNFGGVLLSFRPIVKSK